MNNDVEKNPCFVALTRAMHQLIIIQDEQNPYLPLLNAIKHLSEKDAIFCPQTIALKDGNFIVKQKQEFNIQSAATYSLDNLRPKGTARWIRNYQELEIVKNFSSENEECDFDPDFDPDFDHECDESDNDIVQIDDVHEDVSIIYAFACCMAVEYELTGKVRLLEDIRSPHRLQREKQDIAIVNGHHSRFISPNIPVNTLLGEDMISILDIYMRGNSIQPLQWCELACLARCWNDFHHTMRQLKPFSWFNETKFLNGCDYLKTLFNDSTEFDVRVKCKSPNYDTIFHARVHAISKDGIFYLIWGNEINHTHRINATIRASLSEKKPIAFIVNIRESSIEKIIVKNPNELLGKLL